MEKIPTAEEYTKIWEKKFLETLKCGDGDNDKSLEECFTEFAKLHVKQFAIENKLNNFDKYNEEKVK